MTGKADRAQALLDDDTFKSALQDVRQALMERFVNTPPSDTEQLIDTRRYLHLLDSVEANLIQAIEDGHLEDFRIAEKERDMK